MNIIVNGEKAFHGLETISYSQVVQLAGYDRDRILSVTYQGRKNGDSRRSGILIPGREVALEEGMIFNVADTSNG